ncbi:acetylglutamate kinase [Halobacteriales archaeon QS_3_64_16]|nr:MAG: acetylglutamate kinase [Halobacteriales archaeon QS_3_64_16]
MNGGELTALKLGGSVITDKADPETIDAAALDQATDAIAAHLGTGTDPNIDGSPAVDGGAGLVLVHGGGSFGHHHASEHGVSITEGTHDAAAAGAIHDAMGRLDRVVLDRLDERGVPALPVHPLSACARDDRGRLSLSTAAIEGMLAEGFVPLLHGGVLAQDGAGVTIVSGDELVVALAERLEADRVGLCSTVPGVLDSGDEVIERITSFEAASEHLEASESTDVTGGMGGKVRALLELDVPASIFDLDGLEEFLAGESPGTRIDSME